MDKLVEHGIRMLGIVEGENDFFRNDAKRQADIARAVYDTILRVQVLERKFDKDINVRSKTENSSEKPNNCEHITEGGVTCAKYPACDDCLDNPLNKVKGSERLLKGKDEPQMGDAKPIPLSNRVTHIKDEPQTEVVMPKKCKGCDSASKIIEAYSRGFEDGAEAVKKMPQTEYERASEQREHDILYEPTYDLDNGSM